MCGVPLVSAWVTSRRVCVAGGNGAFVRRLSRGFDTSSRRPHHVSSLVTSGSVISGLHQSSLPLRTPQIPLLQEPSTGVVQLLDSDFVASVASQPVPQQGPRVLASASPVGHPRPRSNLNNDHRRFRWIVYSGKARRTTCSLLFTFTRSHVHGSHQWFGHNPSG